MEAKDEVSEIKNKLQTISKLIRVANTCEQICESRYKGSPFINDFNPNGQKHSPVP